MGQQGVSAAVGGWDKAKSDWEGGDWEEGKVCGNCLKSEQGLEKKG